MKVRLWLARLDRITWINGAASVALAVILLIGPPWYVRLLLGIPLLVHLGYSALTGLPIGMIPRRPDSAKAPHRRNQDLRSRVVGFLNDIRSIEAYAQQAVIGDVPRSDVEATLRKAQTKIMRSAAEMVTVMGRSTQPPDAMLGGPRSGRRTRRKRIRIERHEDPFAAPYVPEQEVDVLRGLRGSRH
jgi:hypothetical protein